MVQALRQPQARNKAFDLIALADETTPAMRPSQPTAITTDFAALFTQTTPGR